MSDMRAHGVDVLTLGQYLRPTEHHLSVVEYVTPEMFDFYRVKGEVSTNFRTARRPASCPVDGSAMHVNRSASVKRCGRLIIVCGMWCTAGDGVQVRGERAAGTVQLQGR